MICVIFYYTFFIPFNFGISGGYYMHSSTAWFAFNVVVNLIFLFDAFLQFSRAYRDDSGTLVFSLVAIRKNYIRSGWFFMNLLASFPTAMFLAAVVDDADPLDSDLFRGLWVFELFNVSSDSELLGKNQCRNHADVQVSLLDHSRFGKCRYVTVTFLM